MHPSQRKLTMPRAPDLRAAIPSMQLPDSAANDPDSPSIAARTRRILPIDLSAIRVNKRLRDIDADAVTRIAYSMSEIGQQSPISVRPDPDDPALFILVTGAHRLEAARKLAWAQIESTVIDAADQQHRLIEIDENLMRADLSLLDRSRFLAERKRVYLQLHPDRRRGGDRSSREYSKTVRADPAAHASWADETSELISLSPRTVQRAVTIGEGIPDELAIALAPTPLAHREGDLYRLSQMPEDEQGRALDTLRTADKPPSTLNQLIGPSPSPQPQDPLDRIKRTWQALEHEHQQAFLTWLTDTGWLQTPPDA